jgi:glycosyltransferase involved in cell wall biosynthesis
MNIRYVGPIYNCSGYSQLKFLFLKLSSRGHLVSLKSIGNKDSVEFLHLKKLRKLEETELEYPYINITSGIGPQIRPDLNAAYNIGYSMFETTQIPDSWIDFYNEFNEIWVPSHFCLNAFNRQDINCRVKVVPFGIDEKLFHPKPHSKLKDFFTFLAVGKWIDRKGWDLLINAYTAEFLNDYKVRLCIKSDEQTKTKHEMIKEYLCSDQTSHMPRIMINCQKNGEDSMPLFYQEADCFILPSRGEAFNVPSLEAMSCGIPSIVSDFGGHLDFVTNEVGWLIPVNNLKKLSERLCRINTAYKDLWFAEPEIKDIRKIMRYVYEHKDEVKSKGHKARTLVENSHTWNNVADIAEQYLNEIWNQL